jgi:hypothetical protein
METILQGRVVVYYMAGKAAAPFGLAFRIWITAPRSTETSQELKPAQQIYINTLKGICCLKGYH